MRPSSIRALCAALAATAGFSQAARAEDIDLFTTPNGGGVAPNILIVLDNSANWNANNQAWPTGKQGEGELRSLWNLMNDAAVNTSVNIGLMMMQSTNVPQDSAYIRYHVRNMTPANKAAFQEMIGTSTCVAGNNSLTGKKNCILKDFSSNTGLTGSAGDATGEMTSSASTRYEGAMFEVFKYFGGFTDPPRALTGPGGTPVDSNHFGPAVFAQKSVKADPAAYSGNNYVSPINADGSNSCAKNFVIFIGNGYPSQSASTTYLTGINGSATVPPPVGNKANFTANWSKYLFTTDVSPVAGRQNVVTYAIDVFNAQQDANQTALMKAMAKYGGGRYFEAKNDQAILNALKEIIIEIQAVNSVFASASLPINATNRSQNENQVFIGMFRPDPDAKPKWYGNLKQYQVAYFGGDAKLADKDGLEAIAATTGFLQACASSFWTTDSGNYWDWSANSVGSCVNQNPYSDAPDGGIVEKGGAAEVVRKSNNPLVAAGPYVVNRNMYTMASSFGSLTTFDTNSVTMARTGTLTAAANATLVDFIKGKDVLDENGNYDPVLNPSGITEPRPSIHGDIAHSRPLPVNYGGGQGVVVYYGSNDGTFKAVQGKDGKELWSFVAPEHHSKLKRLFDNSPLIAYPNLPIVGGQRKDYFFDGSAGLYQNIDNTQVWIYPTMRRGGRMVYAFDVTTPTTPVLKWSFGCPNMGNDTGCSSGADQIGQTWSGANVFFTKGVNSGSTPIVIFGGGYDSCEDNDDKTTVCTSSNKGNRVYVVRADSGALLQTFNTDRAVAADVTLLDRDFDSLVDYAYVADTGGSLYRINFRNPADNTTLDAGNWTITKIAKTQGAGRKFLFAPAALVLGNYVYVGLGSGDRERPLQTNYPYVQSVQNRYYMYADDFTSSNVDLDGSDMQNFTSATDCSTSLGTGKKGWYMDLNAGRGEQTVTSSVVFGGIVFFSTNRPVPTAPGTCGTNLGEARGYAVNVLNASGIIGTGGLCGGDRSGTFTGGGLPPSPVVGTVPIQTPTGPKPTSVLIGGVNIDGGASSPIGAQVPPIPIRQVRSRIYWYPQGER